MPFVLLRGRNRYRLRKRSEPGALCGLARRALGKDGLKGQAQPRIADAICQAADSVYTVGEPFFSSGRDENGLDLRLRARVEIVAYFLHWASRSMHMFDCAEIFDSSVEKVLADLRRYLARDHHQELREFGLPQFERYFLETLGEREADYAFQYPESDDGVEFLTMLACRL